MGAVDNFDAGSALNFALDFSFVSAMSILLGIFMSVITTLMFKHIRFISHSMMHENALLLFLAFICWEISIIFDLSGVMGLLTMGFFLSHYNFYNLSQKSRESTSYDFFLFRFKQLLLRCSFPPKQVFPFNWFPFS